MSENVVLIGMPGAGKSTIGVLLAKTTGRDFVDTDVLIQVREGRSLQAILQAEGYLKLRAIEEQVILGLTLESHVIATGGSAVYSDAAMAHLMKSGTVVFLDVPFEQIGRRVRDLASRGIAAAPGTTLRQLYDQRRPLYLGHADVVVDCGVKGHEDVLRAVMAATGPTA
jgi:shikimate kinase